MNIRTYCCLAWGFLFVISDFFISTLCRIYGLDNSYTKSVAICVRGFDRNVENARNIMENIVVPLDADVFEVVQTSDGNMSNFLLALKAVSSDNTDFSIDDVVTELKNDGFNPLFWKIQNKGLTPSQGTNALSPIRGRGSALFQYKSFKRCFELIAAHEEKERGGQRYRSVIIIRSDSFCFAPPFCPSQIDQQESIIVPSGEDYNGLNDRMIAMPRSVAELILTGAWNKLAKNVNSEYFRSNTEKVLSFLVAESQMPLVRTGNTCYLKCNQQSQTIWVQCQTGGYKYKREFESAKNNFNLTCSLD